MREEIWLVECKEDYTLKIEYKRIKTCGLYTSNHDVAQIFYRKYPNYKVISIWRNTGEW